MFKLVKGIRIKIECKEVARLLGHSPECGEIKKSSKKLIREMVKTSSGLIEPEGVFTIKSSRGLKAKCLFESSEKVAFCICTIGKRLENEVRKLSERGEPGKAVILDAIGSVAAELTAEYVDQVIKETALKKGFYGSTRFSPGYGGWGLEMQKLFFELLPAKRIGVSLNESFMMKPRKSVSFAVNLNNKPFRDKRTPCEICGFKRCRFKKVNNSV
ncbi:MAG: hypothetical protein OEV55_00535 [candidate division Zixibacteria bacterium]|nr:hypothetical protein [candidate division Zixibacteria bacterium]